MNLPVSLLLDSAFALGYSCLFLSHRNVVIFTPLLSPPGRSLWLPPACLEALLMQIYHKGSQPRRRGKRPKTNNRQSSHPARSQTGTSAEIVAGLGLTQTGLLLFPTIQFDILDDVILDHRRVEMIDYAGVLMQLGLIYFYTLLSFTRVEAV